MSDWNEVFGGVGFVAIDEPDVEIDWLDLPGEGIVDQFRGLPESLTADIDSDDDLFTPRLRTPAVVDDGSGGEEPNDVISDETDDDIDGGVVEVTRDEGLDAEADPVNLLIADDALPEVAVGELSQPFAAHAVDEPEADFDLDDDIGFDAT